jgi:hypothetical protein
MKIGAWFHTADNVPLDGQLALAAQNGITMARCYSIDYARQAAPALRQRNLSLLAGLRVDGPALVADWRSQLHLDEIRAYHNLGIKLDAICVGNELREGGDEPGKKKFTRNLASNLVNLLNAYRVWLSEHHLSTPLTYAMEGIVFDETGNFLDWVWQVMQACDIVGINSYPMENAGWFTFGAFDESRRFLIDSEIRKARLADYEKRFRLLLDQVRKVGKPIFLTETGFPSAVGYRREGERLVVPESDNAHYEQAMEEFLALIRRVDDEYGNPIRGMYFYEWRDNLYHAKIWNVEGSPIHVAFGLCDRNGVPKMNLKSLIEKMKKGESLE